MSHVPAALAAIRARVDAAARAAGREPGDVCLLAVSKTHPVEAIQAALGAGQRDFGESRAQELRDKSRSLEGAAPAPRWHFIGHLQRNKVKYVVGRAALIHAVDSARLAEAIGARARSLDVTQRVLVEVNIDGEAAKSGVSVTDALALCAQVDATPGVALAGLMAIPRWREDPAAVAPSFQALSALAAEGRARGLALDTLSMGMSQDFEVAIACGATLVRVGTAIFGRR